jgi:hypothetical protein
VVKYIFFFHNKNGSEEEDSNSEGFNLKLCREKKFFVENNVPKKEAEKEGRDFVTIAFASFSFLNF